MNLRKIANWYHATDPDTAEIILQQGQIVPNKDNMIFLANSKLNAGWFCRARGLSEYVVFKIPRRDLHNSLLFENPAMKGSWINLEDMITSIYARPISVTAKQAKTVEDHRDLTEGMPGATIQTKGNGKTYIDINIQQFFDDLANKIGSDNFNHFENLMASGRQDLAEKLLEKHLKGVN